MRLRRSATRLRIGLRSELVVVFHCVRRILQKSDPAADFFTIFTILADLAALPFEVVFAACAGSAHDLFKIVR